MTQLPQEPDYPRVPGWKQYAHGVASEMQRMSAAQRAAAGVLLIAALTVALWLSGIVASAATLAAYATMVLAAGTVGLAWGAIGTYVEQRRQITAQQHQLELAWENEIAQVIVRRISGPGDYLRVNVTNNSTRAIRCVYVWADIDGFSGHYEAVVQDTDPNSGQAITSRRMRVFRITVGGSELYRCLRTMLPGDTEAFVQFTQTSDQPLLNVDNAWIKAQAIFADIRGTWWKASEDGDLEMLPEPPTLVTEHRPVMGRTAFPVYRGPYANPAEHQEE